MTFSLLAVTDLDTCLASSRTRATIWSLLDLGAASDSLLAKFLVHGTAQCIANLGARSSAAAPFGLLQVLEVDRGEGRRQTRRIRRSKSDEAKLQRFGQQAGSHMIENHGPHIS